MPGFPAEYYQEADTFSTVLDLYRASQGLQWTMLSPAPMISPGERAGQYRVGTDSPIGDAISAGTDAQGMPRDHYPDSLTFLMDVMNNHALPVGMRIDAARHLLPYQHARLGEKGKKEQRKETAAVLAGAKRFAVGKPPGLRSIDGGKPPN